MTVPVFLVKATLVPHADKEEKIKFYTVKSGFIVDGAEMDGNVNLVTACDPVVKLWLRDQDVELVDFMAVYK